MSTRQNREQKRENRLINEKSPYLLQHAYNPVDWHPWGEAAFQKAKDENKPVFLSIGYSTCHWCHVMEKESFEDDRVAELLNKDFISIKVDREERPDVDHIYMTACQALTGQGGWPLSVFLTAEKKPFFAATYLPKHSMRGMSGLLDLLPRLVEVWNRERERVEQSAAQITDALRQQTGPGKSEEAENNELPAADLLDAAYRHFESSYDLTYGGFGAAPKFPSPHQLAFLLRYWKSSGTAGALDMAVDTLKAMHRGGIFDQLGYGMHRYSVDRQWLVPHFEKMLYDQATTALAALEAYQASGDPEMAVFARKILDYVLTDLTSPEGGFYSAEDADSEGEEGTFYVWRPQEIKELLGPEEGRLVADYFGVTEEGNFEKGSTVLHRPEEDGVFAASHGISEAALQEILARSRPILLRAREQRERPFRDDKIITAWNGLMIGALSRGAAVLGENKYAAAAGRAADFILEQMASGDERLYRRYREGEPAIAAFLEDYAFLAGGLLELYRATFNSRRLEQAYSLTMVLDRLFYRSPGKLQFSAAGENIAGLSLDADAYDGAMPSGYSVSAANYLRLGRLLRDDSLIAKGEGLLAAQAGRLKRFPAGHSALLAVLDYALTAPEELVIAGPSGSAELMEMAALARLVFKPRLELLYCPAGEQSGGGGEDRRASAGEKMGDPAEGNVKDDLIYELCPFLKDLNVTGEGPAAFYCRDMRCLAPVGSAAELEALLTET